MRCRNQRGQSLIEFAMTMPLLALMFVGSLSLGKAAYDAAIVQESVSEASKMAAIDRLNPAGTDSFQMNEPQLLDWIRASAHMMDNSIDGKNSIVCTPGTTPQWKYDSGNFPPGLEPGNHSAIFKGFGSLASGPIGDVLSHLNTGLGTMKITYNYDPGFSAGFSMPIKYVLNYSKYTETWFPFSKSQAQIC
ncbi:MAG: TadE/TadG family type IV pilus assembly protein [Candidatus Dormibacteria bacterium]